MCVNCFTNADLLVTNAVLVGGAGSAWWRGRLGRRRPVSDAEVDAFLARLDQSESDEPDGTESAAGTRPTMRSTTT